MKENLQIDIRYQPPQTQSETPISQDVLRELVAIKDKKDIDAAPVQVYVEMFTGKRKCLPSSPVPESDLERRLSTNRALASSYLNAWRKLREQQATKDSVFSISTLQQDASRHPRDTQ
jgi:hypothetical protein